MGQAADGLGSAGAIADVLNPDTFFDRIAAIEDELARMVSPLVEPIPESEDPARRSVRWSHVAVGTLIVGLLAASALTSSGVI